MMFEFWETPMDTVTRSLQMGSVPGAVTLGSVKGKLSSSAKTLMQDSANTSMSTRDRVFFMASSSINIFVGFYRADG